MQHRMGVDSRKFGPRADVIVQCELNALSLVERQPLLRVGCRERIITVDFHALPSAAKFCQTRRSVRRSNRPNHQPRQKAPERTLCQRGLYPARPGEDRAILAAPADDLYP